MQIEAGQIWNSKTEGVEVEVLDYIVRNNAVRYKRADWYVTDCAERFKKSFEFVRNKGDVQMFNRTYMEAMKKSFLDCMSELAGMLPKAEDEDEEESGEDMVNKPPHYKDASGIECKEITCHRKMPFSLGNAIKYLYRAGDKGDLLEDLKKAEWYLRVAYLNDEKVPKAVEVRLLEVAAHRKTAVGRALNLISLREIAAAYRVVKSEIAQKEKLHHADNKR